MRKKSPMGTSTSDAMRESTIASRDQNNTTTTTTSTQKCNQSTTNKIYLFQEEATSERQEAIIKVAKGIDD